MVDPSRDVPANDRSRLRQLIAALCDDAIAPSEREELEQVLLQDAAARQLFLESMCVHAGLEWEATARDKLAALLERCASTGGGLLPTSDVCSNESRQVQLPRFGWRSMAIATAAAAAVIALAILQPWNASRVENPHAVGLAPGSADDSVDSAVAANLTPASSDCHWTFERGSNALGSEANAGDTLRLTDGTMKVLFVSGVEVTLAAPALIDVVSPMRGRVFRGRATVNVPSGAEGFTIDTPGTSVIDQGTMFGVEVDDIGRTDVFVFKGIVDMAYPRPAEADNGELNPQRLYMGEGVRVDERGTVSRIVWLNSDRFATYGDEPPAPPSRLPVISAVDDNITRADSDRWKFYEIVPEGMREDAKAFVDRLGHEWNGIDEQGMPPYLIGGDYVKTFNNDKYIRQIEVFVTLDRPANLYVLFDSRGTPPRWLRDEFEDTGDAIGVDEARHVFPDGAVFETDGPGVGSGVSVETLHTIWRRVVTEPGTIRLGPTGATDGNFNMYGIVAVPLP